MQVSHLISAIIITVIVVYINANEQVIIDSDATIHHVQQEKNPSLDRLLSYLSINTSHPIPDYSKAVQFLKSTAELMELPFQIITLPSQLDVVVITYKNLNENELEQTKSIMLSSHTDVVPVDYSAWNTDPFVPEIINGRIYARGSQDMKGVGIQYLEAVYRLKQKNQKLNYIIHIVFVPEEEVGGKKGMEQFLETKEFKNLNVALSLDEGLPFADPDTIPVFYGEKVAWWFKVTCEGNVGHGSQFIKNTASSQLSRYMQKAFDFRSQQEQLIDLSDNAVDGSDVVTINLDAFTGGSTTSINVVPRIVSAYFDSRIPPSYNLTEMQNLYTKVWTEGTNCTVEWIQHSLVNPVTDLQLPLVQKTIDFVKEKYKAVKLKYFPAFTDARYVRRAGVPCLGISFLGGIEMLLHGHNEYITVEAFMQGITYYEELLIRL
jgi:aminoacylase